MRGRDIKKNGYEFAGLYVILAIFDSHKWLKQRYPAIHNHLLQYEDKLKKRGQCRYLSSGKVHNPSDRDYPGYPGMHHWLELDNNPRQKYMDDFDGQKILYSEIVKSPQFYLDDEKFIPEATTFLMSGEHLDALIKYMNSNIVAWIFRTYYAGGGLGENGYRYKKAFLVNLPIPRYFDVESITDEKICQLYNLTDEEIYFISSSVK